MSPPASRRAEKARLDREAVDVLLRRRSYPGVADLCAAEQDFPPG
jgi:hypothetical protein